MKADYWKLSSHTLCSSSPSGWSFCACGARTGPLLTFTAQKEWHRAHRKEVRATRIRKEGNQ